MLNKLKNLFKKDPQKEKFKKAKEYYEIVQKGALFYQFIYTDLELMKKQSMNRSMRRRFEKQMESKGVLNKEMVDFYESKVDQILKTINEQLKAKKKKAKKK